MLYYIHLEQKVILKMPPPSSSLPTNLSFYKKYPAATRAAQLQLRGAPVSGDSEKPTQQLQLVPAQSQDPAALPQQGETEGMGVLTYQECAVVTATLIIRAEAWPY